MRGVFVLFLFIGSLFSLDAAAERPFRVVGLGKGADCATLQEAIDAVPSEAKGPLLIQIQAGRYYGNTVLNKARVILRGEGPGTVLSYSLGQAIPGKDGKAIGWQGASALWIRDDATDTVLEDLTLENSYGKGMQAQACAVEADRVIFRRCRFLGWQDTLLLVKGRHWLDRCYISGHVDFIYGGATALFEACEIFCRDEGYIVAPATPAGQVGFVFDACTVKFPYGDPRTYLGRPWKESPEAVFIRCELGAGVRPEGWKEWRIPIGQVRFAEYGSTGPGAEKATRVAWAIQSRSSAPERYSREKIFGDWNPVYDTP